MPRAVSFASAACRPLDGPEIGEHEIAVALPHRDPRSAQLVRHHLARPAIMRPPAFDPARLRQRSHRCLLRQQIHVERTANPVQHVDDRRRPIAPPHPRPAQPEDLLNVAASPYCRPHPPAPSPHRSRARRHTPHRPHRAPTAPPLAAPAATVPAPTAAATSRSDYWGWPKHQPRRRRHPRQHRIHVDRPVPLRRHHHPAARHLAVDLIHAERVLRDQQLRPGPPYELINSPISSSEPAPTTIRAGSSPYFAPMALRSSVDPPSGYRKSSAAAALTAASAIAASRTPPRWTTA